MRKQFGSEYKKLYIVVSVCLSVSVVYLSVSVCCMHASGKYIHPCTCMLSPKNNTKGLPAFLTSLIRDRDLLLNGKLTISARLDGQQVPRICLSLIPKLGVRKPNSGPHAYTAGSLTLRHLPITPENLIFP